LTHDSFKILFDKYFNSVRSYLYYRCGDKDLATDIAQDTFLKIWEKQLMPEVGKEKALLFKIAGDMFVSLYRKQKVALAFSQSEQKNDNETDLSPAEVLEYNELKTKYEKVLSEMPEKQRMVFLMSRMDGEKNQNIANNLNISLKAVEKRMTNALAFLRKFGITKLIIFSILFF